MSKHVSATELNRSTNQYIMDVINEKKSVPISIRDYRIQPLLGYIREWAGGQLAEIFISGSSAKGTALKGSSDLDLFISLRASTGDSLKEIFHSLFDYLKCKGLNVRAQNVSVRVTYYGLQIDLVPGRKLPNKVNWHLLHTNRRADQDRIQTNVVNHCNHVIGSNRINEITALKIWRQINKIDFPSMYLEMYTIKALSGKWSGKIYLADNIHFVLEHIATYFHSTAVYDPSNTGNTISNTLYKYEKDVIQAAAQKAVNKKYWKEIIY